MMSPSTSRYRPSFIALHWITLALLVAVYVTMEARGLFPRGSAARETMKSAHYFLGIGVFILTWLRLALRFTSPTPPIVPTPPAWQSLLASGMALSLYALLLAMPLLGYLLLNAHDTTPMIAGLELPRLINTQPLFAERIEAWHGTIATVGYFLIASHAAAAIYHHHIRHDNALTRMSFRP